MTASHYWVVKHKEEIMFTGTFIECWKHYVALCGNITVKEAENSGYRVTRFK